MKIEFIHKIGALIQNEDRNWRQKTSSLGKRSGSISKKKECRMHVYIEESEIVLDKKGIRKGEEMKREERRVKKY